MDRSHRFQEEGVFGHASAIGALVRGMIAAGGNSQSIAKFSDLVVLPHGVNQRITALRVFGEYAHGFF
jgi:hypothetical protein